MWILLEIKIEFSTLLVILWYMLHESVTLCYFLWRDRNYTAPFANNVNRILHSPFLSVTTVFNPTSSKMVQPSSTSNSQDSPNDAFSTSEYIIIGLVTLLVCLIVAIVVAVLCCCGCCKCECRIKKRRDRTEHPPVWTTEVAPNISQQYPMDNSLYLRALPYGTKEDNYITVMA